MVDISGITNNATSDSDICNLMISDVELELNSHVHKDVLHGIVSVHINMRSFSFVWGTIQRYKTAEKQTKTRVLRKGISRSCKGHPHGSSGDNRFHGNTRELEVL